VNHRNILNETNKIQSNEREIFFSPLSKNREERKLDSSFQSKLDSIMKHIGVPLSSCSSSSEKDSLEIPSIDPNFKVTSTLILLTELLLISS